MDIISSYTLFLREPYKYTKDHLLKTHPKYRFRLVLLYGLVLASSQTNIFQFNYIWQVIGAIITMAITFGGYPIYMALGGIGYIRARWCGINLQLVECANIALFTNIFLAPLLIRFVYHLYLFIYNKFSIDTYPTIVDYLFFLIGSIGAALSTWYMFRIMKQMPNADIQKTKIAFLWVPWLLNIGYTLYAFLIDFPITLHQQ